VVAQGDDPNVPPPTSPQDPASDPESERAPASDRTVKPWFVVDDSSSRKIARKVIAYAISKGATTEFELANIMVDLELNSHPKWKGIKSDLRQIVGKEGFPPGSNTTQEAYGNSWDEAREIVDEALDEGVWGNWQLEQFIRYKRYDKRKGWLRVWGCIRRMRLPWDRYRYNPLGEW
jgi:hypothetical protein